MFAISTSIQSNDRFQLTIKRDCLEFVCCYELAKVQESYFNLYDREFFGSCKICILISIFLQWNSSFSMILFIYLYLFYYDINLNMAWTIGSPQH